MTTPRLAEPTCMIRGGTDRGVEAGVEWLYRDAHVAVVNKPSGLLVHRGWDKDDDVVMFRVRDALGQHVFPVHRLDRGTSGALVFALSPADAAALGRAFELSQVAKTYLALVRGMPPDAGTVDYPIPRSEDGPRVPAITHFRVVARSTVDRCSLVEARPETGRLHQVRRHLRHINHPLVGDVRHGSGEINRHYRKLYAWHRLALHAYGLTFPHPVTALPVAITAPLPPPFMALLRALGLAFAPDTAGQEERQLLRARSPRRMLTRFAKGS